MNKWTILMALLFALSVTVLGCTEAEEPYICHLYGYVRTDPSNSLTGINNLVLKIYDINPYDISNIRMRETTTGVQDSIPGFFEMDSVCYGTSKRGGNLVTVFIDSTLNPYPTQYHTPFISGEVDTIIIEIATD